jgi:hypothetical protein
MTEATVRLIIQGLNAASVRYLVVGGLAVNAYGHRRLTQDVDLLIQLEPQNLHAGMEVLRALGYLPKVPVPIEDFADPAKREMWKFQKHMLVFGLRSDLHPETDVDVFVDDPLGFDEAYDRAVQVDVEPGLSIPICSYADLVKLKLAASRPKDLEDLRCLRIIRGEA